MFKQSKMHFLFGIFLFFIAQELNEGFNCTICQLIQWNILKLNYLLLIRFTLAILERNMTWTEINSVLVFIFQCNTISRNEYKLFTFIIIICSLFFSVKCWWFFFHLKIGTDIQSVGIPLNNKNVERLQWNIG